MGGFPGKLSGGWESAKKSNPELWEKIKNETMNEDIAGTHKGQWSARKAQLAVKRYKDAGGKYIGSKSEANSLVKWTEQDWTTKSGKPSHITGERYLPMKAISHLTSKEYQKTSELKRNAMNEGIQVSKQPRQISAKVRPYRS
jgi:hypothetical protein